MQPKTTKDKKKNDTITEMNQSSKSGSIHISMQETMRDSLRVSNILQTSMASQGSCQNALILKSQIKSNKENYNTIVDMDQIRTQFKKLELIRSSNQNGITKTSNIDEN